MSQSPDGGPGPASPWDAFGQDAPVLPPGPDLAALTAAAMTRPGRLTDAQLPGAGSAARRRRAHAGYLEVMAVAEYARRADARLAASRARGARVRSRDGEYAAEEPGFEMTASPCRAGILLDMARNIVTRLPATLAGMKAGGIDRDRARVISDATAHLPGGLARAADEVLAPVAPGMRVADLQRKAARLEARLDPEGVAARKDHARRSRRVEVRRENSGAASLAGREPDPADALTGKASIDAEAVRLRRAGLPGTLDQIRAMIFTDRLHPRSPGCGAQAATGPIDHTIPYPAGPTCEENLSPPCARHHHAKHAPGRTLEQPQPGVMRWTTPSGRVYTTYPTQYDE